MLKARHNTFVLSNFLLNLPTAALAGSSCLPAVRCKVLIILGGQLLTIFQVAFRLHGGKAFHD